MLLLNFMCVIPLFLQPGVNMDSATFSLNTLRARAMKQFRAFNMLSVEMNAETLEKVRITSTSSKMLEHVT